MSSDSETPKPERAPARDTPTAGSAPLDPFEAWRAARDASLESLRSMRDASLENWSKTMINFVNSDAYSQATAQWLDAYLTASQPFQRTLETTMTQTLTGLNMPTRDDVTSLAGRLTNIEMRLDDLDIKLDDIQRAVQTLSSSQDDILRAIQTHSSSQDDMQHDLDAKLDDIQHALQTLSSLKDDIQSAVQTLSISKHEADTSATTSIASASPVKGSDEPQGMAPTKPANGAGPSAAKRSGGKQGKAKEVH